MGNKPINNNVTPIKAQPRVIPRENHNISRENISDSALKVLYRLTNAGYKAYLVGGAVRDLLLGIQPKDFDVVTDAHPEQIRELFRNCRLIGRRFRLAHVRFGNEIIEVSTFRAPHHVSDIGGHTEDGRIIRDNVYGTIDDDVWRRDFTVNAMFYEIENFSIVDYVGGIHDIETKQIRLIGDPRERYREDPVRMLRAVRFAAKLGFSISEAAAEPIHEMSQLLEDISEARLYEEFNKLFMSGAGCNTFKMLNQFPLFSTLFPEVSKFMVSSPEANQLFANALTNTDSRIKNDLPVTPAFIIAAMLWPLIRARADEYQTNGVTENDAIHLAGDAILSRQVKTVAMPRRITLIAREIWSLQSRLKNRRGKRPNRLLGHPRFRAAFDFLELRSHSGENLEELVNWWQVYQEEHPELLYNKQHHKKTDKSSTHRRKRQPKHFNKTKRD